MEIENNITPQTDTPSIPQKKSKGLKIFALLGFIIIIGAFGYFAYFAVLAPFNEAEAFRAKYKSEVENTEGASRKSLDILALENEIAFQLSDVSLTGNDSVYLVVDLVNSLIKLELQGITLDEFPIIRYKECSMLKNLDPEILNNYISKPFIVENTISTIEKMALKTKLAPKNEEEASMMIDTIKPDTAFVRHSLFCDRDLTIEIVQDSIVNKDNILQNKVLLNERRKENLKSIVTSALNFQPTSYTPSIVIVLSKKDARTIYRAIPYKAQIALRLGFHDMPKVSIP